MEPVVIAERALIAKLRRLTAPRSNRRVPTGIGDDCAVIRLPGNPGSDNPPDTLVTTDFSLEGIHFRRDWHSADSVGHRCLARGLSDIAAMGGQPVAAFLSLALPRHLPQGWVDAFSRSLLHLARKYGVTLAGGDTAESPAGILTDIVVVGSVPKGTAVLRSRARPGDFIYVSGTLGGSAAALRLMQLRLKQDPMPRAKIRPQDYPRHFFPEPRIRVGQTLRQKKIATAMIDISDGLSTDLAHICRESGVGAELQGEAIPRALVGKPLRPVDLDLALHGGEDYELLFTAPPGKRLPSRIAGIAITQVGHITRQRKIFLRNLSGGLSPLQAGGWEHFRG